MKRDGEKRKKNGTCNINKGKI